MFNSLKTRWFVIVVITLLGLFWLSPNFVNFGKESVLSKNKIALGLDIQGGLHLVMGVDVVSVVKERAGRQAKDIFQQLQEDGIPVQSVKTIGENSTELEIVPGSEKNRDAVKKYLDDRYGATFQLVESQPDRMHLKYFDAVMIEMKKQVVSQAIEVIRNRIDEFGVAEPSISAQGTDRILVQLPGVKDALRAKELINRTARLDFRVLSTEITADKLQTLITEAEAKGNYKLGENGLGYGAYIKKLNADLESQLPKNTKIVFEKLENAASLEAGRQPYLVTTDSNLSGDQLEDAAVQYDEMGKPKVTFSFTVDGRRLFAELTEKATGGRIAIVLDDVVKSAPSVEAKIDSESAQITLGGVRDYQAAFDEATFIATALRAGSLPAALEQLEERTVGPSLGSDLVEKAKFAAIIGVGAIFVLMFFLYGTAGLVADFAMILNLLFTFAVLSTLNATLTIPGIAGIALTVGMSIDANIIVYERIREELAKGGSLVLAIKDGFGNAFDAIFDANLTIVLSCAVLMYYGTGPVRGFAVSLMIGVIVSMFTAIFVSRTVIDTLVLRLNMNILNAKKG